MMSELLNQKIFQSKSFKSLQLILKNSCIKGSTPSIPYDEFENIVIVFIKEIMKLYLENTEFCNDMCSCVIRDLSNNTLGEFDIKNHINHIIVENVITIDKGVVKAIYFGKINFMSVIFHELNHFKNTYDMKLGRTNKDVIRVIKETLLTIATQDNIAKKNATKSKVTYINDNIQGNYDDNYYQCNYGVFSDEKIAEINAIKDLILFIKITGLELSELYIQKLNDEISKNTIQYNNYLRDFRLIYNFNDYFLDFEEAFDEMIKFYPNWLAIPQLNVEYYLDKDGNVAKRTKKELEKRLKTETDKDIKEYIQYLLSSNISKKLDRNEFQTENKKSK